MSHLVTHAQDVRHPLGLRARCGSGAAVRVLDDITQGEHSVGERILGGLRVIATDVEWALGDSGPTVKGPSAVLINALNGRAGELRHRSLIEINYGCHAGRSGYDGALMSVDVDPGDVTLFGSDQWWSRRPQVRPAFSASRSGTGRSATRNDLDVGFGYATRIFSAGHR